MGIELKMTAMNVEPLVNVVSVVYSTVAAVSVVYSTVAAVSVEYCECTMTIII